METICFDWTLTVGDTEIDVEVEASVRFGKRGNRRGHIESWNPDDSDEVEIDSVLLDGVEVEVTADQMADLEEAALDEARRQSRWAC